MYYEVTAQFIEPDEKTGRDKRQTVRVLVEHPVDFSEAETVASHFLEASIPAEFDITAIRRTRIMEFANAKPQTPSHVYYIVLRATTVDDSLKEKEIRYLVALYASSISEAQTLAASYRKQGFSDMSIVQVTETKIANVIPAQ